MMRLMFRIARIGQQLRLIGREIMITSRSLIDESMSHTLVNRGIQHISLWIIIGIAFKYQIETRLVFEHSGWH